jgi:hypothetical protein
MKLPFLPVGVLAAACVATALAAPIEIGNRRELFVDDALVERVSGRAELRLNEPVPREVVLRHDEPWEGAGSGYHSVFQDGALYRMYYKAWQRTVGPGTPNTDDNPLLCCYAESDDGIHWRKPALGLFEFQGSKANNIVMASGQLGALHVDAGHPAVFKDLNPAAPADARYKAFFRSDAPWGKESADRPRGLLAFKSADGIHFTPLVPDRPVITNGAFDSQNLAFWDTVRGEYRAYWRYFQRNDDGGKGGATPTGTRAIRTATSKDFIHWQDEANLGYLDSAEEQLYVNQIKPYPRAPHLFIGFPMRYLDRGWSEEMRALPELEHREWRASIVPRLGTALTDSLFMASRDGLNFKRWNEVFLRPGPERAGAWTYGQTLIAWEPVVTRSAIEGASDELSFYVSESYWSGRSGSTVRRYTLRLDGFVSLHAPMAGGELLTKPVRFAGSALSLNFATSAIGSVRVELQDEQGRPFPGFSLEECAPLFGDTIDRTVRWQGGSLAALAGQPVCLRFAVSDAQVYSFQFRP